MTRRRFAFAIDQSGGNAVYQANLRAAFEAHPDVEASYHGVHIVADDIWQVLPGFRNNYAITASARAAAALHAVKRRMGGLDAAFIHSQSIALFAMPFMKSVPTVISSDGTPKNYDTYADGLEHPVYSPKVEAMKALWTKSALGAARHLLAFSTWVKDSYVNDYGADPAKVTVIPPGIDTERWVPRPELRKKDGKVRILFTGGNFPRKGGPTLLKWAETTKHRKNVEVHLVTQNDIPSTDNVVVHNNMKANTPELVELAQSCDIFALPTLGDCFPFAGIEASCTGMPIVISHVGGIAEMVSEGQTGYLVPRRDETAFFERLDHLVENEELRERMGAAGRKRSAELFNASRNATRVYDLLMSVAEGR